MKDINHYTTLSEEAAIEIENLDQKQKLAVIKNISFQLMFYGFPYSALVSPAVETELRQLNQNQSLGLMKALCDRCQETLISK